jgi:hypothetical protein
MPAPIAVHDALPAQCHPRAVIAATDAATKHGCIVLANLNDTGFLGGIYCIGRGVVGQIRTSSGQVGSAVHLRHRGVADRRLVGGAGRSPRHTEPADPS